MKEGTLGREGGHEADKRDVLSSPGVACQGQTLPADRGQEPQSHA